MKTYPLVKLLTPFLVNGTGRLALLVFFGRSPQLTTYYLGLVSEYSRLTNEYSRLVSEYSRLTNEYLGLISEYSRLMNEYLRLTSEYSRLISKNSGLTNEYSRLHLVIGITCSLSSPSSRLATGCCQPTEELE
jgi:hypothetical protein